MLTVYLAPLAFAIVLLRLDRFELAAPISWGFFAAVGLLALGAAWCLVARQRMLHPTQEPVPTPPGRGAQAWLALVSVVAAAWALALAVTDAGPLSLIWTWPGDPLTSRLIASMLLTIAIAGAWSLRRSDPARALLAAIAVYAIGLALAGLESAALGKPVPSGYVLVWGIAGLGSLAILGTSRHPGGTRTPEPA